MKIDVRHIIRDHMGTLTNARTGKLSMADIALFYAVPAGLTYLIVMDFGRLPESFYSLAISVFSIFAALLFSVQIALFGILQRSDPKLSDTKLSSVAAERLNARRIMIHEVNANISYLILIACLGVAMLLFFSLTPRLTLVRSSVSTYFVVHFVLTILLVIARVHTLFDEEYRRP